MIQETLSRNSNPALTSDRWHVLLARWSGKSRVDPLFTRSIVSEHDDRASAVTAAEEMLSSHSAEMAACPVATRDQILVRRPAYKSLVNARRRERHG